MHPMIKKAILTLSPPLRHIIEERNQLRLQLQAAMQAHGPQTQRINHRVYTTLNVDPIIGTGSIADDKSIVERLLTSYQRSSSDQYGNGSVWREFYKTYHKDSHRVFMRGDVEEARQILANPAANNMFYGFDELCALIIPGWQSNPKGLANSCQDNLIRLAEALGASRLENPEFGGGPWLANVEIPTNKILQEIEAVLGKAISFPDIYPGAVGANSFRGIVTYRAIHALYLAFRLRQIVEDSPLPAKSCSICEIGAGLGRSALYANQLGLKDYTIVDVPMTAISQGYYLMRCLGEDAVALPGEARRSREQIRIMHPEDFFSSHERFDLIANVDSLSELGHDLAARYLKKISMTAPNFLSINHEANSIRVIDLLKELDRPYKISRYPYWMRQGYVEELVKFQP